MEFIDQRIFLNNFINQLTVFANLRYTYMILLYVLSFFLSPDTASVAHDIHISKAEIHFKSERKVLQISLHIFLDDLEAELKDLGPTGCMVLPTSRGLYFERTRHH